VHEVARLRRDGGKYSTNKKGEIVVLKWPVSRKTDGLEIYSFQEVWGLRKRREHGRQGLELETTTLQGPDPTEKTYKKAANKRRVLWEEWKAERGKAI